MSTTTTSTRKKKGNGLLIAGAALGTVLLAIGAKNASANTGPFEPAIPPPGPKPLPPPPAPSTPSARETLAIGDVVGIVASAAASRDPKVMRAAAARLRAAGWPTQAGDLEELARRTESLQPMPPATSSPAPAPVKPPPASSTSPLPGIIPTSNPSPPPATSSPATSSSPVAAPATIKKGSTGVLVAAWQSRLNTHGFGLTVDQQFGDATDRATRDYQTDFGLVVDGIVGPNTWAASGAPILGRRTLRVGSRGPAVKSWQFALIADGLKSAQDGVFSTETESLTKIYQAARGIAADGVVGPNTVGAIGPRKPAAAAVPVATTIDPTTWRNPLKEGMTGKDVGEWQLVLIRDVAPALKADGIFGPNTKNVTIHWQAKNKLTADGIVGPATRAKIASGTSGARVAGDLDLAREWRQLEPSSPLPGLIPEEAPTEEVAAERALAATVAHNLHFAPPEGEDRELVAQFQALCGLNVTGAYGPGTAKALIQYGFVPPRVRYWPSKGTLQARADYKATLLAQAKRDRPRSAEWLAAARALDARSEV